MRPDDITADIVRQALGAIRSARPLAGSPLLRLDALAEASAAIPAGGTTAARTTFLRNWLEGVAWTQLTRLRGGPAAAATLRPGPAEALAALAADFRADSADREAWGILHFHYFSGSSATRGQVATAVGVGYNTVRRRLERGHELLAAELRERERSAAMATERAHNVPRPPSRFIGREAELGAIRALMAKHRLVVLTGPGGIGKSRLAIHLAQNLAADYPDGSWFTELATALDGHRVPQAILGAMSQREIPGQTLLATLTAILAERRMLLVLDNCEHVATACAELLAHLLPRCPALEVLATSREQLATAGAAHWPVPPLALPAAEQEATVGALIHFDGPRLFSARAAVAEPGFALTDATAGPVGRICAQLDGIPLALEMAAGRLGELSLARIEAGLADRFSLLVDGRHASRPGHETLRTMMDWSYDLLSEPEQRLFRRLAVFRGGWTLELAETVCAGGGVDAADVLDLLTQLDAKSLLQVHDDSGERRFAMLETVRQYSEARLAEAGEVAAWRDQHLAHFEGLALARYDYLPRPVLLESDPVLLREIDNFRAALQWALDRPAFVAGARILVPLGRRWEMTGLVTEASEWMERYLAGSDDSWPVDIRAMMLYLGARLDLRLGKLDRAIARTERSRALYELREDRLGMAHCDRWLGEVARQQGRREEAISRYEAARTAFEAAGFTYGLAHATGGLALLKGDRDHRLQLLAESEALFRQIGDVREIANIQNSRGYVLMGAGRDAEARTQLEAALAGMCQAW